MVPTVMVVAAVLRQYPNQRYKSTYVTTRGGLVALLWSAVVSTLGIGAVLFVHYNASCGKQKPKTNLTSPLYAADAISPYLIFLLWYRYSLLVCFHSCFNVSVPFTGPSLLEMKFYRIFASDTFPLVWEQYIYYWMHTCQINQCKISWIQFCSDLFQQCFQSSLYCSVQSLPCYGMQ